MNLNLVNIGLMLATAALAIARPFELFIFSYAVLGPAHYLTEIPWLHRRGYFTQRRHDYLLLVVACAAVTSLSMTPTPYESWVANLNCIAFFAALIMTWLKDWRLRLLAATPVALFMALCHTAATYELFFVVFLTTLVHVFIFTGAFILAGALRERSVTGFAAFVVFLGCAAATILAPSSANGIQPSAYIQNSLQDFRRLSTELTRLLVPDARPESTNAMRFIAFAYTYHFLNWFSKTSIIKWHEVSKRRLAVIAAIWLSSLALYAYDFRLGLKILFFLSFLHVLLEFPLNHRTLVALVSRQAR